MRDLRPPHVRNCCFKVKCAKGVGPRGAISCDAGNYYMDSTGEMKQTRIYAQFTERGSKRSLDATKAAASEVGGVGHRYRDQTRDALQCIAG